MICRSSRSIDAGRSIGPRPNEFSNAGSVLRRGVFAIFAATEVPSLRRDSRRLVRIALDARKCTAHCEMRASACRAACGAAAGARRPRARRPARAGPPPPPPRREDRSADRRPPPRRLSGSGGSDAAGVRTSGEAAPLVVAAKRERREDLAAEPGRPDAVARVADAVVDARVRRASRRTGSGRRRRRSGRPRRARPSRRRAPGAAAAGRARRAPAVATSPVNRPSSSRPPWPIGPEPLPISTRPSAVVRK